MKFIKLSSIYFLIFCLLILAVPSKSIYKADAAGRLNLAGTLNKSSYNVGEQVAASFTSSFTGSSPSSSQRFKFTSKLVTQTNPNNLEYTVYDNTFYGNSTWYPSGTYYYSAPATAEGTFYVQFKAYDMNLNQMIEQVNTTVRLPSTSLPNPVVTVYANGANPLTVNSGTSVNITWTSTNTTSNGTDNCTCTYNGGASSCGTGSSYAGSGTKSASGNPYTMTATTTFNVTCTN